MRSLRNLMVAALALALSGCAALTPIEGPPIGGLMPASSNSAGRDTTNATATGAVPVPAPVPARVVPADSTPSADAREVLASIPEPLPPGERVPPPSSAAPADTGVASADTSHAGVPTPAPTRPMGDPGVWTPPPIDTTPPPSTPAAPTSPPATRPSPARPDTCWRLQVGAPETPEEAEQKRSAAESLLMSGFVVEKDGGLYKVRTRECVSRATALALRDRAIDSGFAGAFPIAIVRQ